MFFMEVAVGTISWAVMSGSPRVPCRRCGEATRGGRTTTAPKSKPSGAACAPPAGRPVRRTGSAGGRRWPCATCGGAGTCPRCWARCSTWVSESAASGSRGRLGARVCLGVCPERGDGARSCTRIRRCAFSCPPLAVSPQRWSPGCLRFAVRTWPGAERLPRYSC